MPNIACDYCGKEFYRKPSHIAKNERQYCSMACYGMARKRKETRTCPVCLSEFTVKPSEKKQFCSPECAAKSLTNRILVDCRWCGGTFECKARVPAKFCSRECYILWKRHEARDCWEMRTCPICEAEFRVRKKDKKVCCSHGCANIYRRNRVTVRCETCNIEFEILSSIIEKGFGRFCSWECYNEWQKTRTGELAANWRGGKKAQIYPKAFNAGFRRKIRRRDEYTCAICRLEGADVHHIDYVKEHTTPENCITLCKSCHGTTNANRDYWQVALSGLMQARVCGAARS